MLHRFLHYVWGGLRLELRGPHVEAFINGAMDAGIPLWDLVAGEQIVRLTLPPGRFWELRDLARRTHTRVHIRGRSGLPFRLTRLRTRYALWAGLALVLAAVWWATAHVWVVQVEGTTYTDPRAVLAAARTLGLAPGVWRDNVDLQALQRDLPMQVGSVTWAAVHTRGVRAVVTVVEKRQPAPVDLQRRLDIVAAKPGVILQIVALSGQPMVKVGDQVQAGQTLIAGQLMIWQGGRPMVLPGTAKPPRETPAKDLPAQGYVLARVTYNIRVEVPRVHRREEATGDGKSIWRLRWGQKEILLGKEPVPPGPGQMYKAHRLGDWRIPGIPVEVQRERHDLVNVHITPLPPEVVLGEARAKVMNLLSWSLPPGSKVEAAVAAVEQDQGDLALVKVHVVTIENIGQPASPGAAPAQP